MNFNSCNWCFCLRIAQHRVTNRTLASALTHRHKHLHVKLVKTFHRQCTTLQNITTLYLTVFQLRKRFFWLVSILSFIPQHSLSTLVDRNAARQNTYCLQEGQICYHIFLHRYCFGVNIWSSTWTSTIISQNSMQNKSILKVLTVPSWPKHWV